MTPLLVVHDQLISNVQDGLSAAVILLEAHDLDLGVVFFKVENVAKACAPPTINRLIGVACHGQVAMGLAKSFED